MLWCQSLQDVCTEAALKVNISPVALDFFTLVSEDGGRFLHPNKVLSEVECSQVYLFKLCIKACHGLELRDFDRQAFEYYFHQVRVSWLYNQGLAWFLPIRGGEWSCKILAKFHGSRSLVFWAVLYVSQSQIFCDAFSESRFTVSQLKKSRARRENR